MRIYFDHNATTPVAPAVAEAMIVALTEDYGNASSVHHFGQQAKARLDDARSQVAALIGAEPSEVVFTSGGTEADNLALRGAAEALEPTGRRHLIATTIEHEAVLVTLRALARWSIRMPCSQYRRSRSTCAHSESTCSRSPATSSTARKAPVPFGSSAGHD
jgi:cysteine sulfinate desulfinase/cysteine desulfurase-like protein